MKELLEGLLPRIMPELSFTCIPHEGKQDLEKSIPRKLRAWNVPGDVFVIIRDQDSGDCKDIKRKIAGICLECGTGRKYHIRIACHELEAWYFGEPAAIARAFNNDKLAKIGRKKPYRIPDAIKQPSKELAKLIPEFQKVSGAKRMAQHLSREGNESRSFQVLIECLSKECQATC